MDVQQGIRTVVWLTALGAAVLVASWAIEKVQANAAAVLRK